MDKTIKKILLLSVLPFVVIILMMYRQYSVQNNTEKSNDREIVTNSWTNNIDNWEEKFSDELSPEEKSLEQQKAEDSWEIIENTNSWSSDTILDLNTNSWITSDNTSSWSEIINPNVQKYFNDNYSYWFEMPKNVYFSWFGAQNNSNHSIWIFTWTWTEDFSQATVKVYFYSKKLLPELNNLNDWEKTYSEWKYFIKSWTDTVVVEWSQNDKITQNVVNSLIRNK